MFAGEMRGDEGGSRKYVSKREGRERARADAGREGGKKRMRKRDRASFEPNRQGRQRENDGARAHERERGGGGSEREGASERERPTERERERERERKWCTQLRESEKEKMVYRTYRQVNQSSRWALC
jgi:hypothetical protein